MAVKEQRPVDGSEVEEHDQQNQQVINESKQPQHTCRVQNQGRYVIWIYDGSKIISNRFITMLPLVHGNMELTFRENVDRAQHINCTQCNLQVRISQYIRFIYGLVSHIHCTGRWYETEVRNSATCLLSILVTFVIILNRNLNDKIIM